MSVENTNLQLIFRKWKLLAKSITSPRSNARICPKTCMQVRKTFLEKRILNKAGVLQDHFIQNTQKIPNPSTGIKSNSHLTEIEKFCKVSEKHFSQLNLQELFIGVDFKSRSVWENPDN